MSEDAKKAAFTGNSGAEASTTFVAGPAKSSAGVMVVIALLAVAGSGGAAWYVLQHGRGSESERASASSTAPKYLVHLEGFTVNLADAEETHFLRVTIDLGIDRLPEGVEKEKASAAMPVGRIRDAILSVLTVCKADTLLTPDGKTQLKKNLVDSLNRSVPELGVREVYFTEFLVQR
jgi:flagellar FliL protein